jgi:hypothetical protein
MRLCDVVDQLLYDHGLADVGPAEQADPALGVRRDKSTTLMPVATISASVDWSTKDGAGAWIGRLSAV